MQLADPNSLQCIHRKVVIPSSNIFVTTRFSARFALSSARVRPDAGDQQQSVESVPRCESADGFRQSHLPYSLNGRRRRHPRSPRLSRSFDAVRLYAATVSNQAGVNFR